MSHERMNPRRPLPIVAVIGMCTASLGISLYTHIRPSPAPEQPRPASPAQAAVAPSVDRAASPGAAEDAARVRRLELRIAEMEGSASEAEPAAAAEREEETLDPAEALAQDTARWEGKLTAHEQERRDPTWSEKAEGLFQSDFSAMARGRKFEAASIDCRTTSCVATVTWPSYAPEEVQNDAMFIAGYPQQENCATSVSVPPPEDRSVAYRAQVIFDCSSLRKGLARR